MGGHQVLKKADIIFSGATYGAYLPQFKAKKCMLFHGTYGSISEEVLEGWADFDHLFLHGPRMERQLLRHKEKYNLNYSVAGYIPFALFPERSPENRKSLLNKLGLDPNKKTVVYTPSKSLVGTWLQCAEDIARQTPPDYNLVLRPHPNQANSGKRKDKLSFKKVRELAKQRSNCIIDLSICSLPELECVADLMITDANSPAEESLFYDCAQLFADANRSSRIALGEFLRTVDKLHEEDIHENLKLFDCGPSRYADGFGNWADAITHAIQNKDKYTQARNDSFKYIFGEKDTNASERVIQTINNLYF